MVNRCEYKAEVIQGGSISNYLNASVKCFYLGDQGNKTYDFNVRKEFMGESATYKAMQ